MLRLSDVCKLRSLLWNYSIIQAQIISSFKKTHLSLYHLKAIYIKGINQVENRTFKQIFLPKDCRKRRANRAILKWSPFQLQKNSVQSQSTAAGLATWAEAAATTWATAVDRNHTLMLNKTGLERKKILIKLSKTTIFSGFLKFPAFFSVLNRWGKGREISKAGKNHVLETWSNIFFPLALIHFV